MMQSINDLKNERELDLLLFKGVNETQPHTYGQQDFHSYHEFRERFGTVGGKITSPNNSNMKYSKILVLDKKTNKLSVMKAKTDTKDKKK